MVTQVNKFDLAFWGWLVISVLSHGEITLIAMILSLICLICSWKVDANIENKGKE